MTVLFFMKGGASILTLVSVKSCRLFLNFASGLKFCLYWGHLKKPHGLWWWLCMRLSLVCLRMYSPPSTMHFVSHPTALISNESSYTFWAECLDSYWWLEKSALEGELQCLEGDVYSDWSLGSHCGLSIEGVSRSVTYWQWNVFVYSVTTFTKLSVILM
jgi:hypothetical protein